jgi:hypothetical protein
MRPAKAAELWRRGIALFYAGRLDEGGGSSNGTDGEPARCRELGVALPVRGRQEGFETARARLLAVEGTRGCP